MRLLLCAILYVVTRPALAPLLVSGSAYRLPQRQPAQRAPAQATGVQILCNRTRQRSSHYSGRSRLLRFKRFDFEIDRCKQTSRSRFAPRRRAAAETAWRRRRRRRAFRRRGRPTRICTIDPCRPLGPDGDRHYFYYLRFYGKLRGRRRRGEGGRRRGQRRLSEGGGCTAVGVGRRGGSVRRAGCGSLRPTLTPATRGNTRALRDSTLKIGGCRQTKRCGQL